ncbi:threonine--tRNA ligase [Patescibacteria group bacterium]|nr:threonine--tRNA ligase [Patescibacteria group bacterium]MBU1721225.1 threonine--tRNA ligase [Patescibacteria group bacterium]MBU1901067.1 threonine--tRNA ligase [Patescibacteria group bacterium]
MEKSDLEIRRKHSASHIMTAAVEMMHKVGLGVGPWTDDGFYQDFDFGDVQFSEKEFKAVEKKMRWIVNKDLPIKKAVVGAEEARAICKDDPYKLELVEGIIARGEDISFYYIGEELDKALSVNLCAGPHLESTGQLGAFKLTKLAGAYWRGDENKAQLQRIYGIAFSTQEELDAYLHMLEEAEKRDHRKLGKELDLFSIQESGPGFPFWHPNGMVVYSELEQFIRMENRKRGYSEVKTPIILNKDLWVTSGHWDKFGDNMYFTEIDEAEYAVKPMNCPGGLMIYKARPHSYKELPIRNGEFGLVHRHEKSGVLHGLFRVRAFTQDDAHSFCRAEQLQQEIVDMVEYAQDIYTAFGFTEYTIYIATRPEKYIGSDEDWENATEALKKALEDKGLAYEIKDGEGAFYGPKIEFNIKDSIGRMWQCGTIQVDYSMPARFGATYTDNHNQEQTPIMIHRAILGSFERFIGILIEHYAGAFPVWMSPVQVHVIPVSTENHLDGAKQIAQKMKEAGIRVSIDEADETVGKKIRKASQQKVPYMLVVGDNELEGSDVMVRVRGQEKQETINFEDFIARIEEEIRERK